MSEIDHDTAQALLSERYAPGRVDAEAFAVAILPWGSEIPDFSADEWDGMFVLQNREDMALLYYRLPRVAVQLELWE